MAKQAKHPLSERAADGIGPRPATNGTPGHPDPRLLRATCLSVHALAPVQSALTDGAPLPELAELYHRATGLGVWLTPSDAIAAFDAACALVIATAQVARESMRLSGLTEAEYQDRAGHLVSAMHAAASDPAGAHGAGRTMNPEHSGQPAGADGVGRPAVHSRRCANTAGQVAAPDAARAARACSQAS